VGELPHNARVENLLPEPCADAERFAACLAKFVGDLPNHPARDYYVHIDFTSCVVVKEGHTSAEPRADLVLDARYGTPIGWILQHWNQSGYFGLGGGVTFDWPDMGISIIQTLPFENVRTMEIYWTGVQLLVADDCDSFVLNFTGLRVVWNGVELLEAGSSFIPLGAYSVPGGAYRLTERKPIFSAIESYVRTDGVRTPPCNEIDVFSFNWSITGTWEGGWQHYDPGLAAWVSEPTRIDALAAYGSCTCSEALPGYSVLDTNRGSSSFETFNDQLWLNWGPVICPSDTIPPGPPLLFDPVYYTRRRFRAKSSSITIVSETHGVLDRRKYRRTGCSNRITLLGSDYVEDIDPETDPTYTYCPFQVRTYAFHGEVWCQPNGNPLVPVGVCKPPILCSYEGTVGVDWPIEPPCGNPSYTSENPWLHQDVEGRIHVTDIIRNTVTNETFIRYRRGRFSTPEAGLIFEVTSYPTAPVPGWWDPRSFTSFAYDGSVWITASYDNGVTTDLYIMRSTDEGLTWTGATIVIPNTSRGTCAGGSDGSSFIAGFRLTGPGVGNLIGKYREAGDTAYSTEFTFQTAGAVNIATEDESFHIYMAHDVQGRWVGVWKIDGETQTSVWWSVDQGRTWTRVV
jgi:hypothetical protein